jgi:hypothetical protein
MADETKVESDDFGPDNEKMRREFLMMLAIEDGPIASLSESLGQDIVPLAIKAIAMELSKVSIELMEAREEIADLKMVTGVSGAFMAGLLDVGLAESEDDDPEMAAIRTAFRQRGLEIREGALA